MEDPPNAKFKLIYDAVGLADPALYTHSKSYLDEQGVFVSTGPVNGSTFDMARSLTNAALPCALGGVSRKYK